MKTKSSARIEPLEGHGERQFNARCLECHCSTQRLSFYVEVVCSTKTGGFFPCAAVLRYCCKEVLKKHLELLPCVSSWERLDWVLQPSQFKLPLVGYAPAELSMAILLLFYSVLVSGMSQPLYEWK